MKKLFVVTSLILLAACSPESAMERKIESETGGNADVDMKADGSMTIETDEGTYQTGNSLPDDWPSDAPVYANATVQFSGSVNPTTGEDGSAAVLVTTDSAADVVAYYKKEVVAQGWKIETTMVSQGSTIIGATKGDRAMSLMVGGSAEGQTTITIGVGKK